MFAFFDLTSLASRTVYKAYLDHGVSSASGSGDAYLVRLAAPLSTYDGDDEALWTAINASVTLFGTHVPYANGSYLTDLESEGYTDVIDEINAAIAGGDEYAMAFKIVTGSGTRFFNVTEGAISGGPALRLELEPVISTGTPLNVGGGTVIVPYICEDNGGFVSTGTEEGGLVVGTSPNPDFDTGSVFGIDPEFEGTQDAELTGLSDYTVYYVRAGKRLTYGDFYGNEISFLVTPGGILHVGPAKKKEASGPIPVDGLCILFLFDLRGPLKRRCEHRQTLDRAAA